MKTNNKANSRATLNIDRFDLYLREGRLARHQWVGSDADGRATACWLAALSDGVAEAQSMAGYCPSEGLPPWLAHLIPWMDDCCSLSSWKAFAERLGKTLRAKRTPEQWLSAEYAVRDACVGDACVDEAMRTGDEYAVRAWRRAHTALLEQRPSALSIAASSALDMAACVAFSAVGAIDVYAEMRRARAQAADRITDAILGALELWSS